MKESEMTVTKIGNNQLYIPLSKKLEHGLKAGDKVHIIISKGGGLHVIKID